MQVGTERQAGSELHAWRQFLARSTLWLGVLLLGSAAICWVAANWQDMSKVQRFAGAQTLLAVCALAAAWAGLRLRTAAGARGAIPGALLALAGILLGALLALLGQTYQTGADTWELFAWWAVLLLPWALAAASQGSGCYGPWSSTWPWSCGWASGSSAGGDSWARRTCPP